MTLGDFIKQYREEHGQMSIRRFAALSGLSATYIRKIERGFGEDGKPVVPTMTTYKKIAEVAGLSEIELLSKLDDSVLVNPEMEADEQIIEYLRELHSRPEMRALFDTTRGMSAEQIRKLVSMIEGFRN